MNADTHSLTGAYVCNALSEPERAAYERHLARCAACRQEVAELQDTAARLGDAVGAEPPAWVRERVMRQIQTVRQAAPPAVSLSLARERRRRLWIRRTGWAAAAVLVAGAGMLGAVAAQQNHEIASMRSERAAMSDLLAARDLRTTVGRVPTGGTVTIMASRSRDAMMIAASGLASLPSWEAYEVWMKEVAGMRPGPVAHPSAKGVIGPMMAEGAGDASAVTITVEPAAGSPHPTSSPVIVIRLSD